MAGPSFVDYVKIYFTSGAGGAGAVSWRREKFVDMGGPDGGDGGQGGSIIVRGNAQLWTLLDLKYRKFIKAEPGQKGSGQRCAGRAGKDEVLEVPIGTVVKEADTERPLGEITKHGQELVLLKGGRGGLGNWHFRSSTNQTPDRAQPGEPAQELTAVLELKVLADVGLVGFPNAGKSTLLSVLTAAKPAIADYPFTTIVPNLGIVRYRDYNSFVMADIPGIIEGAHLGKGLGVRFLRHVERNAVLLFMVPVTAEDVKKQYQILLDECAQYNPVLLEKPRVLAITQCDLDPDGTAQKKIKRRKWDVPLHCISSVTGQGLDELKDRLWDMIHHSKQETIVPLEE
jgi:GTP-binding protein